jgi:predicted nucleotidyltransferase
LPFRKNFGINREKHYQNLVNHMGINEIKNKIIPVLKPYGVKRAGLFGSAARGEMKIGSDVDIVVDIQKDISLLDFIELKLQLEQALERSVDLVEYQAIKPLMRERILREQVSIL